MVLRAYLPVALPAGLAITFKYCSISDGTQICSTKSCWGIHLNFALLMTNGLV